MCAPVTLSDTDGSRIYRRSLTLLLVTAAAELFPDAAVFVEHSAPTLGAYYCRVRGRAPFTPAELDAIAARMREIVAADVPIHKTKVPVAQAVAIFDARGETDKARLLAHRQQDSLVLYELCGRQDYFQGYMLPSTGRLRRFACTRWATASCCSTRTRPPGRAGASSRPIRSCSRPSSRPAPGSTRWASAAPAR